MTTLLELSYKITHEGVLVSEDSATFEIRANSVEDFASVFGAVKTLYEQVKASAVDIPIEEGVGDTKD